MATSEEIVFVLLLLRFLRQFQDMNSRRRHANAFLGFRRNSSASQQSYGLARLRNRMKIRRRIRSRMFVRAAFIMLAAVSHANHSYNRTMWTLPRNTDFWEQDMDGHFNDGRFYNSFRMSCDTFNLLCEHLRDRITKQHTNMRRAISVEKRVAITLFRLAKNADLATISNLFGVGISTVCVIYLQVCRAMCHVLIPMYVKAPSAEDTEQIIKGFEQKWGFPQCGGAVDGSHIPISAPKCFHTDYHNRKGWYSVILQGLVDFRYRFLDFDIGWPGKCHDSWVFEHSTLKEKLSKGEFFPQEVRQIEGVDVPVLILGDSAYSEETYLMKPYPYGNLSTEQKKYNYIHSRSRMVVENAFGRLKNRWRCLLKKNESDTSNIPHIVGACVALHNFCENWREQYSQEWEDEEEFIQPTTECGPSNAEASNIREAICKFLSK